MSSCRPVVALHLALSCLPVAAEDVCAKTDDAGDRDLWQSEPSWSRTAYFRDAVSEYYNLQHDNWDEGWGWSKYNDPNPHTYAYCKMMSSSHVLWSGIDDAPDRQGAWDAKNIFRPGLTAGAPSRPVRSATRSAESVDLLYREDSGRLLHYEMAQPGWFAGDVSPVGTWVAVSDRVATTKERFLIESDPEPFAARDGSLHVFARGSGNTLLHFTRSPAGAWSAVTVTTLLRRPQPVRGSDRYFIESPLTVYVRTPELVDVFAFDNYRDLIHYWWDAGVWAAEDVSETLGRRSLLASAPAPYGISRDRLDVVGLDRNGQLLRYRWSSADGWSEENVSQAVGGSRRLGGTPAAVSELRNGKTLNVFVRSGYDLILYYWLEGWPWLEFDMTRLLEPAQLVESDPVALSRAAGTFDVFATGLNDNLVHFYFGSSGFGSEDLTNGGFAGGPSIEGPVAASHQGAGRLDVFARSWGSHLVHYYWEPELGWRSQNVNADPNVSFSSHTIATSPSVIRRSPSALDVFAPAQASAQVVHFAAPVGISVSSWHTSDEYSARAAGSRLDFRYEPENSSAHNAQAIRGTFTTDRVEMMCPIFRDTPTFRASTMLHEATHMLHWRWGHQPNAPGSSCQDPCSDDWFPHGIREPSGALGSARNHSMNQLKIEFLCDVFEFASWWLPQSAYAGADLEANDFMDNRILDPPSWRCGVPRPLQ